MQSKRESLQEAIADTAIGIVQGAVLNAVLLPLFGLHPSLTDSVGMAVLFTVFSLARRYATRRWFNYRQRKA